MARIFILMALAYVAKASRVNIKRTQSLSPHSMAEVDPPYLDIVNQYLTARSQKQYPRELPLGEYVVLELYNVNEESIIHQGRKRAVQRFFATQTPNEAKMPDLTAEGYKPRIVDSKVQFFFDELSPDDGFVKIRTQFDFNDDGTISRISSELEVDTYKLDIVKQYLIARSQKQYPRGLPLWQDMLLLVSDAQSASGTVSYEGKDKAQSFFATHTPCEAKMPDLTDEGYLHSGYKPYMLNNHRVLFFLDEREHCTGDRFVKVKTLFDFDADGKIHYILIG